MRVLSNKIEGEGFIVFLLKSIIVFLVNPILTLCYFAHKSIRKCNQGHLYLFATLLALYVSGINATKIPVSDQELYLSQFIDVEKNGFMETLQYGSVHGIREPIYGIYVYILHFCFFGCPKLFFLFTSFLSFIFHYLAFINIGRKYKYDNYLIITGILVLTFFTQFFSLTLHIIRQVLATGIVFYSLSIKIIHPHAYKRYLPLMILAAFTHSTCLVPILVSFIPKINDSLRLRYLCFFIIITILFTSSFSIVSSYLLGNGNESGFATYALDRAMTAEGLTDNATGVKVTQGVIHIISLPLVAICLLCYIQKRNNISPLFVNLCLIMCLFVELTFFSPLIQYRYFFYLYSFLLFIIPLLFQCGSIESKLYCICISTFIIIRFFFSLPNHTYHYASLIDIFFAPFPYLVSINPY